MTTTIVAVCDRCSSEIIRTTTKLFLEIRHGPGRLREQVDLCEGCMAEFDVWLLAGPDDHGPGEGGGE